MKKLQLSSVFLLFSILMGLLAACGGETPTATPVPPAATNTALPATNTALPPSPTTVPPTATAVAVAATDTPEAVSGAPTDTPARLQPVGGAATATAAGSGSTGAGATPAGNAVSAADLQLIDEAITTTKTLKSYHFTMSAGGDVFTQPVQLEGDYVAPDKAYFKGTMGGQQIEQVIYGGKVYEKQGGQWVPQTPPTPSAEGIANPVDLTASANVLDSLDSLTGAGTQYTDAGQETVDGVQTRHFVGQIGTAGMMGGGSASGIPDLNIGTINLWIDPSTKYLHRLGINLDLAALLNLLSAAFGQLAGTPEPGTPTATPLPSSLKMNLDLTISRPNDPSITVPNPTQ